ncbi:MAG: hypothetical protein QOK23_2504 [Gammaproteobacteria bacterium]|jgi:hypothetical protein|nr:hypothetical protein [Gammaproteobacteria bacterium]
MMALYVIAIATTLQTGQVVRTEQFVGLMTQETCERVAQRIEKSQADPTVAQCQITHERH